jgi:hypothetical protein
MTYLIKRGRRARYRLAKAHLAHYNGFGQIDGAWCGRSGFDLSSNVPWGLKMCKDCLRRTAVRRFR